MAITTVFDPPLVSDDDATFDTKAFDTMGKYNPWSTEANALAVEVNDDAAAAALSESNASSSATVAQSAAATAESVANYQGPWSSLTGAYPAGISSSHNGKTWRLEVATSDITTIEPGVSGDWTDITAVTPSGNNTFTGTNDFQAQVTENSVTVTSSANSLAIDCSIGNSFVHTLTENTVLSFINIPATGSFYAAKIRIVQDAGASGFAVTFAAAEWDSAALPTLTATTSAVDEVLYYTEFGGSPWCAKQVGKNKVIV